MADAKTQLLQGDCLDVLPTLPADSVDSIVTDPPYGLSFMGKDWDHGVPGEHFWREAIRVAKPGAHMLAFGGTRMFHRLAVAIEDAGWEIRDTVMWVYGSGFPKSKNLDGDWQGWGTALKPAWEPIIVARKPLIGTVAANVMQHGTGAMNIDGCRVATGDKLGGGAEKSQNAGKIHEGWQRPWMSDPVAAEAYAARIRGSVARSEALGRWPANLIHDGSDEVVSLFPQSKGQNGAVGPEYGAKGSVNAYGDYGPRQEFKPRGDTGSASRFFYCAKASKKDRDEGNNHPTVKPTDLMRYLCRLVTPPGGVILDPFMGSGSTGKAAVLEGFRFIGIERETEYIGIARARIRAADTKQRSLGLF